MSIDDTRMEMAATNELKQCRICFDSDPQEDIISPCLCSGGSAYIHRKCLNQWRANNIGGRGFKYCNVCQFEYVIERVLGDPKDERKRLIKYYLYMTRDITAVMLLIQIVILGFAYLLKLIDGDHNDFEQYYPECLHGFMSYYFTSIVIILAIIGIIAFVMFLIAAGGSGQRNIGSSSCNGVGIIIFCATIGLFVGIGLGVMGVKKLMAYHSSQLWLRQEAEKYEVKDFQGRRAELQSLIRP